ncbi:MAG: hydantoinase B/oxoprolinase family protein [Betaproteobacteria bacterium]|nr:hydantoinase B/oxoprolinase family protein [Betaproteobacteria bacterium]
MSVDVISLGIQWDRLISIADEIINSLVRSSFSTNVRESYDLSCVVFDSHGHAIAQGAYSVPSFTGTAPATLAAMLERFPPSTLLPGDVVTTNDPWIGTGHLFDINVMQPVFRDDRIVGYSMSITHLPDIGGGGFSATAREVYEEGLRLPICMLARQGRLDDALVELIRVNVRVPEQTVGDLLANVACTTVGGRMLNEFMDEYGLDSIDPLANAILEQSERAIRDEIALLPDGVYRNRVEIEGQDGPLTLACAVTIRGGEVLADFSGTSPAIKSAINVPLCYTRAMTAYAIKCLTTPRIPNNQGSVRPITATAPAGCLLNAISPSATGGRHIVGHFVVPLIFGALADIVPDRVQADSGMLNLINVQGETRDGRGVSSIFFASGGFGALAGQDGAPTTPSPSNMTGTSIEVWENLTGMFITSKELLTDSGGPGEFRGGLGQRIEFVNDSGHDIAIACLAGRTEFAPQGVRGGFPGGLREVRVNGETVHPKGRYMLAPGDRLTTFEAGGGGFGDPRRRDAAALRHDVAMGYVSMKEAIAVYGAQPE